MNFGLQLTRTLILSSHVPGIAPNFLCVLCICQILWFKSDSSATAKENNMFKYLFMKSVCDFIFFLDHIYLYHLLCDGCSPVIGTKADMVYVAYLYKDMDLILSWISAFFEIAALLGKPFFCISSYLDL
jgi:hypothetical protein